MLPQGTSRGAGRGAQAVPPGCSTWPQGGAHPPARSLHGTLQPHILPHVGTACPGTQLQGAAREAGAWSTPCAGGDMTCGCRVPQGQQPGGYSQCLLNAACGHRSGCILCGHVPCPSLHSMPPHLAVCRATPSPPACGVPTSCSCRTHRGAWPQVATKGAGTGGMGVPAICSTCLQNGVCPPLWLPPWHPVAEYHTPPHMHPAHPLPHPRATPHAMWVQPAGTPCTLTAPHAMHPLCHTFMHHIPPSTLRHTPGPSPTPHSCSLWVSPHCGCSPCHAHMTCPLHALHHTLGPVSVPHRRNWQALPMPCPQPCNTPPQPHAMQLACPVPHPKVTPHTMWPQLTGAPHATPHGCTTLPAPCSHMPHTPVHPASHPGATSHATPCTTAAHHPPTQLCATPHLHTLHHTPGPLPMPLNH